MTHRDLKSPNILLSGKSSARQPATAATFCWALLRGCGGAALLSLWYLWQPNTMDHNPVAAVLASSSYMHLHPWRPCLHCLHCPHCLHPLPPSTSPPLPHCRGGCGQDRRCGHGEAPGV
jgi:hypothetical protein